MQRAKTPDEINLRRLLSRMQARLAGGEEIAGDDRARLWDFVATANELLAKLGASEEVEEDALAGHQRKLSFISEVLSASEGKRPAVVATSATSPSQVSSNPQAAEELVERRMVLAQEESLLRASLLGEEGLRRRLGLGAVEPAAPESILQQDDQFREQLTDDMLHMLHDLKESTLNVQRSLAADIHRIKAVDNILGQNLDNVGRDIKRIDATIQSTSGSCRAYCALMSFVLAVFMGTMLLMKVISPSRS
jgi:hypothetical protein